MILSKIRTNPKKISSKLIQRSIPDAKLRPTIINTKPRKVFTFEYLVIIRSSDYDLVNFDVTNRSKICLGSFRMTYKNKTI